MISETHLHLLLNHIPILGPIFGFGLLLFGLLASRKAVVNAGKILLIIAAVVAIPVFLKGEVTEETVEGAAGVSDQMIEQHEHWADYALWGSIILGALALITFAYERWTKVERRSWSWLILVLTIPVIGVMSYVGNLGGKINHPELRKGTAATTQQEGGQQNGEQYEEVDDE